MSNDDGYTRPGPASIDAGEAVDGIVVHIYAVPSCDLLHVGRIVGDPRHAVDLILADVEVAAEQVRQHGEVCIVMYDGDTGERLSNWPTSWN